MINFLKEGFYYILSFIGLSLIFSIIFIIFLEYNFDTKPDNYKYSYFKDDHNIFSNHEFDFYINKNKILNKDLKRCKDLNNKVIFYHYSDNLNIYIYTKDEEVFLCHT